MKKYLLGALSLGVLVVPLFTHASTATTVQAKPVTAPLVYTYTWTRDLTIGSKYKEDVRNLQKVLTLQGFSPGPIDGIFSTTTMYAVKQYQKKNGLTATGYVGSGTRAKLNALYGKPAVSTKPATPKKTTATAATNKTTIGKVVSKGSSFFTLSSLATTTATKIVFDPLVDQVIKLVPDSAASSTSAVKTTTTPFASITVGARVMVKMVGGKKIIYILSN